MLTVKNTINASIDKVWKLWSLPEHVVKWNTPSEDWKTSYAENDLRTDGKFKYTMVSENQDLHFDFEGIYTKVEQNSLIEYKLTDDRIGRIYFEEKGSQIHLTEVFEPVKEHPENMQKEWCQAVIDNFKQYTESF